MVYKPTVYGKQTIELLLSQMIYDLRNCTGVSSSAKNQAIGLLVQGYQVIKDNQGGKDYLNKQDLS